MFAPRFSNIRSFFLGTALLLPAPVFAGPPVDSVVVFNEIMFHPADVAEAGEFIELHNQMGINVDLSDWEITGGVNYTFPDGTVIPGGGYLLIARTPALFPGSLGPWAGSLSNGGETLRLRDKNARLLDEVSYGDSGSWPVAADGSGVSLSKPNEDAPSSQAGNWGISAQTGGTPGAVNFPPPPSPVSGQVISLRSAWKYNNTGTDPGASWKDESYDDTQPGWQSGTALFDFGNTAIYDPYPGGPPVVGGNQEITGVTIAGQSSQSTGRAAINCINGSGLALNGTHSVTATNTMWMSNGTALTPQDPLPATITFDLGSAQNLTSIHVWNYNEFGASNLTNRGSKTVEILVAATAGGSFTSVGTFTFNQASGLATEAGQDIPFLQSGVRQVRFNVTANWGNTSGFAGLSEVKFYNDQPAVPPAPPLHRETMRSVFPNTGANTDGSLVTPGQPDPHYINKATGLSAIVETGNGAWLGPDGISQWTGPTASGNDSVAPGTLTYQLNADLTGWDKNTASIQFYASADNSLDRVRVNGTQITFSPALNVPDFIAFYGPFTIPNANLVAGNNVIEFDWTNAGAAANPAGFRAKWVTSGVPVLTGTTLGANPVTTRYRKKFTWNGNPAATYQLRLEHILDDGAVFYLNGQELLRTNMPAGAITHTTPATADVAYPMFSGLLTVPASAFHTGENTLAVEVHQSATGAADAVFAATLELTETPPAAAAPPSLVLNEVAAATAAPGDFFLEIRNTGTQPLNLTGYRVTSSTGVTATLGSTTLAGGAVLSLTEAALGFRPLDGEKLFFYTPSGTAVVDGVAVKNRAQARTAAGAWQTPSAPTAGVANTFSIPDSIVINEIMFKHQPVTLATGTTDDPEEWVELYNRSGAAVDLSGWSLKGGADFTFPAATSIPAGAYFVVAKSRLTLLSRFPSLNAANVFGDWSGGLANSGDTVRIEDAAGNTVNEVAYLSGGRWDERAGGGGSSLELKNPGMDNSHPEAWAGSDESGKSAWQTFSYSGLASPPAGSNDPTNYNEFIAGLLAAGEFYLDDVSVIDQTGGNVQLIQDGGFTAGNASKWRLLGTHGSHGRSVIATLSGNPALKVVATGPAEHMHNHCETTLKNGASFVTINSASTYAISFRAKWISGSPRLTTRLYFNRLNRQFLLPVPMNNGTPGAANSRLIALPQPSLAGLGHSPVIPAAGQPVTVRISAAARIPVSTATLKWQKDGVGTWTDAAMALNAAGQYEGTIPGQTAGSLVQFYIAAAGANGSTVNFPAAGTASRAMIRWNDGIAPPGPGYGIRVLIPTADADFMHSNTQAMSNDYLPCTIVYRENEVFYDAGVRLKSSQRGRLGDARLGFAMIFDPTHKFRGVHEGLNMDRSAYGQGTTGSGFGQVDIINQVFTSRAGGVPAMYNDMVYLIAPRSAHNGSAQMTMAEFNDVYLDSQWDNGAGSPTFKFDLVYFPLTTVGGLPEGLKIANPDDVKGVNFGAYTGTSKEDYRYNFTIGNARNDDDFSRIINLNTAFRLLSQGNSTQVATAIDVDQWLRASAAMSLVNSNDSYSTGGLPHNLKLYVRPSDGRVLYLPWDADFSKMATNFNVEGNADLQRIIAANPVWRRMFYGHLHDLISTSYNTAYLTPWVNHLKTYNTAGGDWNEIISYVAARAAYVTSDCNAKFPSVAFSITTNSGNNFSSNSALATLAGNAWINVRDIRIQGSDVPLTVTWTGSTTWQVQVPLAQGANPFVLEAIDYQGAVVGTDSIVITGTGTVIAADASNLVVSELHYNPAAPTPAEITAGFTDNDDFEFIELQNISASTVNLTGVRFLTGITWNAVSGTQIPPGGRVVIPRRSTAFALRYPGVTALGEYYVLDTNQLDNGGEELGLVDAAGNDIKRFTYNDNAPWPTAADGTGPSLQLVAPAANPDHNNPLHWRSGTAAGGNPGAAGGTAPPANPLADDNNNGLSNLVDYATGGAALPAYTVAGGILEITLPRAPGADVIPDIETTGTLTGWTSAGASLLSRTTDGGGIEWLTFSLTIPPGFEDRLFARVRYRLQ